MLNEEQLESLKGERLGHGCYSSVYALASDPEHWVIKLGNNDGTRTYLEWCKHRQDIGEGLRGMPRVAWIASCGKGRYAACMERLPIDPGKGVQREGGWEEHIGIACYCPAQHVDYLMTLVDVMREETFITGCDMHYQNFMVRKDGTVVMTDPDSGSFHPQADRAHPTNSMPGPNYQFDLFSREALEEHLVKRLNERD